MPSFDPQTRKHLPISQFPSCDGCKNAREPCVPRFIKKRDSQIMSPRCKRCYDKHRKCLIGEETWFSHTFEEEGVESLDEGSEYQLEEETQTLTDTKVSKLVAPLASAATLSSSKLSASPDIIQSSSLEASRTATPQDQPVNPSDSKPSQPIRPKINHLRPSCDECRRKKAACHRDYPDNVPAQKCHRCIKMGIPCQNRGILWIESVRQLEEAYRNRPPSQKRKRNRETQKVLEKVTESKATEPKIVEQPIQSNVPEILKEVTPLPESRLTSPQPTIVSTPMTSPRNAYTYIPWYPYITMMPMIPIITYVPAFEELKEEATEHLK